MFQPHLELEGKWGKHERASLAIGPAAHASYAGWWLRHMEIGNARNEL